MNHFLLLCFLLWDTMREDQVPRKPGDGETPVELNNVI